MPERIGLSAEMDMSNWDKGVSSYNKSLDNMHGQTQSFGSKVSSIFTSAAGVMAGLFATQAVQKMISGIKETVQLAADEQKGILQLSQAVKNTGANWDTASGAIESYLKSELKRIALDDGPGRMAIQKLTEITGDYNKSLKLMPLVADLAAAKNMDLASAAMVVGRVSEGNTGMLARYGIMLTKSKDGAANAAGALAELSERFQGQAEILANTYPGAQKKFEIAIGNIKETIGGALLPVIEKASGQFANWAVDVLPAVEWAAKGVATAVGWLTDGLSKALTAVMAFASEITSAFQMGGGGELGARNVLATLLEKVGLSEDQIQNFFTFINGVQDTLTRAFGGLKTTITTIIADLKRGITSNGTAGGIYVIMNAMGFTPDAIVKVQSAARDVERALRSAWDTVRNAVNGMIADIQRGFTPGQIIQNLLTRLGLGSDAAATIGRIFQDVATAFRQEAERWISDIRASITAILSGNWGDLWAIWRERFLEGLRGITGIAERISGIISQWVSESLTKLESWLADRVPEWGGKFNEWLKNTLAWLGDQIPELGDKFSQVITNVVNWMLGDREAKRPEEQSSLGEALWKTLQEAFNTVLSFGENNKEEIAENYGQFIGSLVRLAIVGVWKVVSELAKLLWELISGVFMAVTGNDENKQKGIGIYNSFFKGIFEGLIGMNSEDIVALVRSWIDGMLGGLEANVGRVMEYVMDWVRRVIPEPIRKALGIGSPSKVAWEIGMQFVEGLALGIDDGTVTMLDRVQRAVGSMVGIFSGLIDVMGKMAQAGQLVLPDMRQWSYQLTTFITTVVNAIVTLAGPNTDFAWALGQAYGAAEQMIRIIALINSDFSKITLAKDLPDMEVWAAQLMAVIEAVVGVVNGALATLTVAEVITMAGVVGALGQIIQLIGVDLGSGATMLKGFDLKLWGEQMVKVFQVIREVVRDIVAQPAIESTGGKFPETVTAIVDIMNLFNVDLSKAATMLKDFNARLWGAQMVEVFGIIRQVVRDILAQPAIERTGGKFPETVGLIVSIMGLFNVDLSKAATMLKGFDLHLWRQQMVDAFQAIREVVRDILAQPPIERTGGKFPETVAAIVAIMNLLSVDLSKATNLLKGFDTGLWKYQMTAVFEAIREVVRQIGLVVGLTSLELMAAQVAQLVQIFGLIMVDLSKLGTEIDVSGLSRWNEAMVDVFDTLVGLITTLTVIARGADLAALGEASARLAAVFALVGVDISRISVTLDISQLSRWNEAMVDVFDTLMGLITTLTVIAGGANLESLGKSAAELTAIFALISVDVSKMSTEIDLSGLSRWNEAMVDVFDTLMGLIITLKTIAGGANLEALGKSAAELTAIFALISVDVSKMSTEIDLSGLSRWNEAMVDVFDTLMGLIITLKTIAGEADLAVLGKASAELTAIFALIAVDLSKLSTQVDLTGLPNWAEALVDVFAELKGAISVIIAAGGDLAALAAAATSISAVVGLIKPAIEAIAAMATYAATQLSPAVLDNFQGQLVSVIDRIKAVADQYNLEGIQAVALFSAAVTTILGTISSAIGAIQALAGYKVLDSLKTQMDNLVLRLGEVLEDIVGLSTDARFAPATLATAIAFATQVGGITSGLEGIITAIEVIANYHPARDIQYGVADFINRARQVLAAVIQLKSEYDPGGITASQEFLASVTTLVGNTLTAMEGINRVAAYPFTWGLDYNMTQFAGYVGRMVTILRNLSFVFAPIAVMSENMASDVRILIGNWNAALLLLGNLMAPGSLPDFRSNIGTAIQMAVNEVIQRMPSLVSALRSFINPAALAGYDLANSFSGGVSRGLQGVSAGGSSGLQSVSSGSTTSKTVNLSMTNNINNGLDVALFQTQVKQIVRDAIS